MHWLVTLACFRSTTPAPEPAPEVTSTAQRLATMRTDGQQCIWEHLDPTAETPPQRIAILPTPCTPDYLLARRGDEVLLTMGPVALRVDLEAGTAARLPPPGRDDLQLATAEWDGSEPVLWTSLTREPAWTEEHIKGKYTLDGTDYPFETDGYGGQTLCVELTHSGGGWAVKSAKVELLYEGMSPPFCGNADNALLSPEAGSGEGSDRFAHIEEGTQPGLDALPADDPDGWVYIDDSKRAALKSMWFEGQRLHGPLALRDATDRWFTPAGFSHSRPLIVHRFDELLLACDPENAAVFNIRDGSLRWAAEGPCPVKWPL